MIDNPWRLLPQNPPYVLPSDEPLIRSFNQRIHPNHPFFVRIGDVVPEAYVGNRNAPVVCLSNNPGIGEFITARQAPEFAAKMRRNLLHETLEYPLLFLQPGFPGPWWRSKLKQLITIFGIEGIARSVQNVVYFPYLSVRFGHRKLLLPSQEYSFQLVKDAINRNAIIIFMRSGNVNVQAWSKAVPELNGYGKCYRVNNPQMPAISRRNCDAFERIAAAINSFLCNENLNVKRSQS